MLKVAKYAGVPAHEFVKLPLHWQRMYETAMEAEYEAGLIQSEQEEIG
jgi:hypothetical protein